MYQCSLSRALAEGRLVHAAWFGLVHYLNQGQHHKGPKRGIAQTLRLSALAGYQRTEMLYDGYQLIDT